jgi:3-hydroxyacyl-CoA dehydrogenase
MAAIRTIAVIGAGVMGRGIAHTSALAGYHRTILEDILPGTLRKAGDEIRGVLDQAVEMVDLVGLDTRLHVLESLRKTPGEKYRPCPLLVQYVKAGRLGRKSGHGVYHYPEPNDPLRGPQHGP